MSRWSWCRGQTEPLAAIFAVSIFAMGLGLYVMAVQPVVPGYSDQSTAEQTADRVWNEIEQDGIVQSHSDADTVGELITNESLPVGKTVAVEVTAVDGNEYRTVETAAFPSGYNPEEGIGTGSNRAELEAYVDEHGPPAEASVATQSVPVAVDHPADVRSGTLRVAVW